MTNAFLDSFDPTDPKDRALLGKVNADRFADFDGDAYADIDNEALLREYDSAMLHSRAEAADILQSLIERGLTP